MIVSLELAADDIYRYNVGDIESAIEELLRSARLGYHIAIIPTTIARAILDVVSLGAKHRAFLEKLALEYPQVAALRRSVSAYVRVTSRFDIPAVSQTAIDIELSLLSFPHTLERTVVVVEDCESDGRFYRQALAALKGKLGFSTHNAEYVHGGGERLWEIAKQRITERRIVVIVADSDRATPYDSASDKVKRIKSKLKECDWPLVRLIELPCREVENIIPVNVVRMLRCATGRDSSLDFLHRIHAVEDKLCCGSNDKFWLYFDVKNGFKLSDLRHGERNPAAQWQKQRVVDPDSGTILEIEGFGSHVIDQFNQSNEAIASFRQHVFSSDWFSIFGNHIRELSEFTAATNPQRA